jgi:hypothetical protein
MSDDTTNSERLSRAQLKAGSLDLRQVTKFVLKLQSDIEAVQTFVQYQAGKGGPTTWGKTLDQLVARGNGINTDLQDFKEKAERQIKEQDTTLKSSLDAWESAVKTKIALDETGNEWQAKEGRHKVGAFLWATTFALSIVAVAAFIYFEALPRATQILIRPEGQELHYGESILRLIAHAIPSAAALIFVVWGLRIVVRMFFVERGLAENAADRKAMIKTLAGLALDKAFDSQQRIVVMEALFRSKAESAINDGSPMEAIQAIATANLKKS